MSDDNARSLPSQWAQAPLPAIAQINPRLDRTIESDDVIVDFVPMRAVEPEGGGLLRPEVSTYGKVKKGYTAFRTGDVIMAKITPCMENGKTCVVPELPGAACFGSTEFHVVRTENGIDPRWIANYLLQHSTRYAAQRQMAGGVGQMRVPASFLDGLKLPVAPESEQPRVLDAIGELLSDLDAGVEALERARAKLRQYRAAVLKAAVEGDLTAQWREDHPATEPASELLSRILVHRRSHWEQLQLQRFKDAGKIPSKNWKAKYPEPVAPNTSSLPQLPAGWCWASIDQLCSEVRNGYGRKPDAEEGVPILRISAVRSFALDLNDRRYLTGIASDYSSDQIRSGDLLFTRYNGSRNLVGVCAVVPKIDEPIVHPDKLIRARPLPLLTASSFFAIAANVSAGRKFVEQRIRTTAGQAGVSGGDVRAVPVPLPPLIEQDSIVELVEGQLSIIDHLNQDFDVRLEDSTRLRQSILRHAFTGKLVRQNVDDESASDLLERIAAERLEREQRIQSENNGKSKDKPYRKKRPAKSRKRA